MTEKDQPAKDGSAAVPFRFNRRQLRAVLCFFLTFTLLFAAAELLLQDKAAYSTTWTRIREDGGVPQVLIMGNSHAFCSFVPDILNGALEIDSAILAASGQDCYGITDSFEALLTVGAPRLVIVEMNAFYFEPGAMAMGNKSTALNNLNGMPGLWNRIRMTYRELGLENVPQGAFQLLRADLMWTRWSDLLAPRSPNRYQQRDQLGYEPLHTYASGDYTSAAIQINEGSATEGHELAEESRQQLRRFLSLAQTNGVEVWLVKAPVATRVLNHPTGLDEGRVIAAEFGDTVTYCRDLNDDLAALDLTAADFYDGGHMNRRGSAKFTAFFARLMGEQMGRKAEAENAFAYQTESIAPLEGGLYRYQMLATGPEVQYRFELEEADGNRALLQDWSDGSTVELTLPPEEASKVWVSMCPKALLEQAETEAMTLSFMTANQCVILQ